MAAGQWYECQAVSEPAGTNCLAFDPYYELLWTGSQSGAVTSYVVDTYQESALQKYTAFHAHKNEVRQLLPLESVVLSLAPDELRCTRREGISQLSFRSEKMVDLQCMLPTTGGRQTFFVTGLQEMLMIVDISRGRVLREESMEHGVFVMKGSTSRPLACGATNGQVMLRDPTSLRTEHVIDAHTGTISDLDMRDNLLVTCGFSSRHGQYVVDPYVKVYDVRTLRMLNMLQYPSGPALLKFMPMYSSLLCVASQAGQFAMVDANGPSTGSMFAYHFDTQGEIATTLDVASSGGALAFGDSGGLVHAWGKADAGPGVNLASRELEYAEAPLAFDAGADLLQPQTPLALVPALSGPDHRLLSDWPRALCRPWSRPPQPVDAEIKKSLKMSDFVGYASNPGTRLRNQADSAWWQQSRMRMPERQQSMGEISAVPRPFRRKDITYSRLGVDDFDFAKYNRTRFAGLEAHTPNAYVNALLQTWFFLRPLRVMLEEHLCSKDHCLACELSFLFHMLDMSKGQNCQASNFVRTFRGMPQAAALSLVLTGEEKKVDRARLLQDCNRFLLNHVNQDTARSDGSPSPVTALFGTTTWAASTCQECNHQSTRRADTLLFDLLYPSDLQQRSTPPSFTDLLASSLLKETHTKAWCEQCQSYKPTVCKRTVSQLADVLVVSCQTKTPEELALWHLPDQPADEPDKEMPTFVPPGLHMRVAGKDLLVERCDNAGDLATGGSSTEAWYELVAVLVHVADDLHGGNSVAEIKVPHDGHGPAWYLFNDFAISTLSTREALDFNTGWKVPCVLYYARAKLNERYRGEPQPLRISPSVLVDDSEYIARLPRRPSTAPRTFTPLTPDAVPGRGYHVAIDAEFVALDMEEKAIRSDGTKSTVRPSQLSLARVSVIHGEHPRFGQAFIDDYICTSEQIMDYLTQFSGINPGDLDAAVSTKHLVTLKATYLKLRCLVDRGVVFVGHGLKKDFRIINIVVPRHQVVDTVDLFYIPRQRRVSLRFLAWYLLNMDVQAGNHDSIEDARTALYLYEKYRQLVRDGVFEKTLKDLYDAGRKYKWKAPHWQA